jgi:excinuclease UvrABC nuclease subunit
MTVALNGTLQPKHYRSFHIRTLKSGEVDDYQSLREAITRRCRRLKDDLPEEEEKWKKEGVEIRKARKADQKQIAAGREARGLPTPPDAYKEFFVATKQEKIVGIARLHHRSKTLLEIRSVWVDETFRGKRLGHTLIRKTLRTLKSGRVYLAAEKELEQYYGELGFRYVIKPPQALLEGIADYPNVEHLQVMVYEVASQKPDASFSSKPDLMVIDGGKGQLSAVADILDKFELPIPVVGLAKREEEIFVRGSSVSLSIPKDSQGRFLLMRLRDEAHRFANAGREVRGKRDVFHSILDEMPGIGETTREALLKRFGTVAAIKTASDNDLLELLSEGQLKQLRAKMG